MSSEQASTQRGGVALQPPDWSDELLDAMVEAGIEFLPYVPDEVLSRVLAKAASRPELTPLPLTREEEGVGIACGVALGGRRSALMMQTTGMGNSLNAIGSVAMAQRVPLLIVVSERGGLGEIVSTQLPLGASLRRILDAMAIPCFETTRADEVGRLVAGAAETAFVCRTTVVVLLPTLLTAEVSA
jgi:sulfopyruvate decarboxylase subunit alpha